MEVFVADTETAGLDGGVCDIAIAVIDQDFQILWQVESLIDPERPIKPSASGVHGITNDMVQYEPTLAEFMELHSHPFQRMEIIGGHNIGFDCRMLTGHLPDSYAKLDTLRLARNFWPDGLDDHKLQTLRYTFDLDAGTAHRAMGDVVTCISLLKYMAREQNTDLAGLVELSKRPVSLDTRISFGKHKGTKLKDLDKGYVQWLLNKADNLDPDLREALLSRP